MVNNKRGLVEKGQHKVQKMCLVSEKPSDLPSSFEMPVFIGVSTREVFRQDLPYTSLRPPLLSQQEACSITAGSGPIDNNTARRLLYFIPKCGWLLLSVLFWMKCLED